MAGVRGAIILRRACRVRFQVRGSCEGRPADTGARSPEPPSATLHRARDDRLASGSDVEYPLAPCAPLCSQFCSLV